MSVCKCIGWWQQSGFGRQPMHDLQIRFADSQIGGQGIDLIAPFTLAGSVRPDGSVEMVKRYLGRHSVLYVGQYDGEGTLYGDWDIDGYRGKWSIKLVRPADHTTDEIRDIA